MARIPTGWAVFWLMVLGLAFTYGDMTAGLSAFTPAVLTASGLGLIAASPLLLGRGQGVRRLLLGVALYGTFLAWIANLSRVTWDPATPLRRSHLQVRHGMDRRQVEAILRAEFRGKQAPRASGGDPQHLHYVLEPLGRYDAEALCITLSDGRVVSYQYLSD